ncbi:MAG: Nramp family divalent metal transporter, partial [Gemmatimonadetes bacterium]|nr:Nramp family divalent metal transporter [Gemmatimonadota bacterium]
MTQPQTDHPVRCSDTAGRKYRAGVFHPLDDASLPDAPEEEKFPRRGSGPPFKLYQEVPCVPRLRHLIGPSVIALGMGLGAGEFLLWPNLVAVNGFSIWWLFWIGVVTQFVVLQEIERWTIATGESVFGGMARLTRRPLWPWFFLGATLISFFWPGWASQSAEFTSDIVAAVTGRVLPWQPIALAMLAFIWIGLAASKIVYNSLERFEIGLVLGFFPMLAVALVVVGVVPEHIWALGRGAVSFGVAPKELLTGSQFPTLLLAVAYAGSGGTLLLAQSLWLRDKGFGMATYQGRIAGIRGTNEDISATGYVFDPGVEQRGIQRYLKWMRVARTELLVTFVLLIIVSVVITTLIVAATIGTDNPELAGNLSQTVALQGAVLAERGGTWLQVVFLLGGAFVLFSTQLGIVDTVTRIAGTIFYEGYGRRTKFWSLKRSFLFFLTAFVLASMAIIVASWVGGEGLRALQPDFLVLIAGPFTIGSMYCFAIVVGVMSARRLPRVMGPGLWNRLGLLWAAILWGWFSVEQVSRVILGQWGAPPGMIETITFHPVRVVFYGAWLISLAWFAW